KSRHHEIVEHVDAGARLGDARVRGGEGRGGRGAHAYDGAGVPHAAQLPGARHHGVALARGHVAYRVHGLAVVRVARVRHHAVERLAQHAGHVEELPVVGTNARAVAVAVDLDEGGNAHAGLLARVLQAPGGLDAVDDRAHLG